MAEEGLREQGHVRGFDMVERGLTVVIVLFMLP